MKSHSDEKCYIYVNYYVILYYLKSDRVYIPFSSVYWFELLCGRILALWDSYAASNLRSRKSELVIFRPPYVRQTKSGKPMDLIRVPPSLATS